MHRDLKLENILLDGDCNIKVRINGGYAVPHLTDVDTPLEHNYIPLKHLLLLLCAFYDLFVSVFDLGFSSVSL